jgi:hypothetical protein
MWYDPFMKALLVVLSAIVFLGANSAAKAGSDTARESRVTTAGNTSAGVRVRSSTTARERQQMPVPKKGGHMFWAARLPWSPNAPGD